MAEAIYAGAAQPGVEVQLLPLRRTSLTRIAAEVLDAAAVAFGSPTLNRGPMPMAAAVLSYLQGLRPKGKAGIAFGSYGWGPGGPEAIDNACGACRGKCSARPSRRLPAHARGARSMPPGRPASRREARSMAAAVA